MSIEEGEAMMVAVGSGLTVIVIRLLLTMNPLESVTVRITWWVPVAVGVQERLAESAVSQPVGRP
jgi:hypothetical protein